jgi:hypothetical protein
MDVMVNASAKLALFVNHPTAVQFPGGVHDTDKNSVKFISLEPVNCAGCARAHTPFVDVMVNAS